MVRCGDQTSDQPVVLFGDCVISRKGKYRQADKTSYYVHATVLKTACSLLKCCMKDELFTKQPFGDFLSFVVGTKENVLLIIRMLKIKKQQ